jgi:hypothetical protein
MAQNAELSSLVTALDELVSRVSGLADDLDSDERDVVGPELYEVERSLRAAQRRLSGLNDGRRR